MQDDSRQAGVIESYEGRGVWVPDGLNARDIMEVAGVLEHDFDVTPYISRVMACQVLLRIKSLNEGG